MLSNTSKQGCNRLPISRNQFLNIQNGEIKMITNKLFGSKPARQSLTFVLLVAMLGSSLEALASHDQYAGAHGAVIYGYDPVAYFTMDKAVKGSKDISAEWLGGSWFFVNQEHRELFIADPDKYMPQYGGYCSASYTYGVDADPRSWQIVDDKLYLFYSPATADGWEIGLSKIRGENKEWEKARAGLLQE
jgi:YHS domain-containing protein